MSYLVGVLQGMRLENRNTADGSDASERGSVSDVYSSNLTNKPTEDGLVLLSVDASTKRSFTKHF